MRGPSTGTHQLQITSLLLLNTGESFNSHQISVKTHPSFDGALTNKIKQNTKSIWHIHVPIKL